MISRRQLLAGTSTGFGLVALAGLLAEEQPRTKQAESPLPLRKPHHQPRAKNVIFCYMSGGVSQVDSFDPKPRLKTDAGKPLPGKIARTQFNNNGNLFPSPWEFRHYGEAGLEVSDLFPHLGQRADDLVVIRSMTAKFSEHAQGNFFMHTGLPFIGSPSAGAWITYGLGSEAKNLPGFVVLKSGNSVVPHGGVSLFSNGYLPAVHQASLLDLDAKEPVRNIRPREATATQRRRIDFITELDRGLVDSLGGDPHLEGAIQNYETAFRMQAAVPELVDVKDETAATRALYGLDSPDPQTAAYARQCLLARRLVERGVRFVELTCLAYNVGGGNGANPWDQHSGLRDGHGKMAKQVDQPIAGLLADLKARDLLKDTLVIWAGEFGRTPFSQGSDGRDHNPYGFSVWLAGGGVQAGTVYGATDDFGYHAVEKKCDVFDLWATVLHQLGLDHEALTFRHGGRDLRLTDVHGEVLRGVV